MLQTADPCPSSTKSDTALWSAVTEEARHQDENIELIASENTVSDEVRAARGSILTNKYAEGYSGARYYGGCILADTIVEACCDHVSIGMSGDFETAIEEGATIARVGTRPCSVHASYRTPTTGPPPSTSNPAAPTNAGARHNSSRGSPKIRRANPTS
ncbi:hypothetical protein [Sphingobium sp. CFD-1]|uniref:hypothetical protein n=1 Tax=unclassified Sphingobium TaxID=2611147 RepID=UPI0035A38A65